MTFGLGNRCSIRLSYGTDFESAHSNQAAQKCQRFEGVTQSLRARGHKTKLRCTRGVICQ